ncbi:MAG TPA: DMT family transporter [Ktedonobacterales bacterium]|nr:DMT family transporter [Ktedonobacterales bacterium]
MSSRVLAEVTAGEQTAAGARLGAGLAPLLASCLWGGMYVVSRASFGSIPPVTLAALRVVIGGLALAIALRLTASASPSPRTERGSGGEDPLPWRRADHLRAFVCGVLVAGCILTQFLGTDLASAHDGALLTTITPVFIVPLAWLLLGERPHARVALGMLVALGGLVLVVATQPGASTASGSQGSLLFGDALLLLSALCWALFTVVGTPLTRRFSALAASTAACLWSIPLLLPLVPIELALRGPHATPIAFTPGSIAAVLYLGLGATALAWWLWYRGVARLPAGIAAVFFFAQPLVGGLLSGLLLHEPLPSGFWLGGLVLAAGILLVSWPRRASR